LRFHEAEWEETKMTTCSDVMTKNPVYCLPTETASQAAKLMRDKNVGPVPVVESCATKTVVGIITDRDLALKILADGRDLNTPLDEFMTREPLVCRADDNVESALDAMVDRRIRRIPVVDDRDRLIGIISQADVATRIGLPRKTGEVVEEISRPSPVLLLRRKELAYRRRQWSFLDRSET
jgi:CBS domain-containing protein